MPKKIERLERKLIKKGSIIDYYQDTMMIPNGNQAVWDFISHKGAAAVVAVKENGNILMVKQYRNALERYTLEIPAGGLNSVDEPMCEAALRELKEETGYQAEHAEFLVSIRTTVAFCNERIDVFYAYNLQSGEQKLDEDEYVEVVEYPVEELIDMIEKGVIQDAKTISAIMCYYHKYIK